MYDINVYYAVYYDYQMELRVCDVDSPFLLCGFSLRSVHKIAIVPKNVMNVFVVDAYCWSYGVLTLFLVLALLLFGLMFFLSIVIVIVLVVVVSLWYC
jgi:hypothetical protein